VTAAITLGWLAALVILLSVGSALPADVHWWIWTCVAGVAMGLFGLVYVPFLKRKRAGTEADQAAQDSGGYVSRDSGSNTVSSTETPGKSTRS
jgi:Protein of unknown function (DUF2530)